MSAALVPYEEFVFPEGYVKIGKNMHHVVRPAWQEVMHYTPGDAVEDVSFSVSVADAPKGKYFVAVTSEVDIGSQRLDAYQSLITMPQYVRDRNADPVMFTVAQDVAQEAIKVRYKPGDMLNGVANQEK